MEKNISAEVLFNQSQKDYEFKNQMVLTSSLKNFRIDLQNSPFVKGVINRLLLMQENNFLNYNKNVLYPQSVKDFLASTNNRPFNPYASALNYEVTYNENCFLSFYYDTYIFTGGAHGNTTRKSNTFSLLTAKPIRLDYFFNRQNYKQYVLTEILRQAKINQSQEGGFYFDDYEKLIAKYFNPNNFYLTTEGVVIYFNQYEIAPYAVGIPEFLISNDKLDNLPKCNF